MDTNTKQLLTMLKALAEENRLTLLRMIHQKETPAGELAERLGLSEPTISHHLARLREAGLVNLRTAGTQRLYRSNPSGIRKFKQLAADIETAPEKQAEKDTDESWIDTLGWPETDSKVLRDYTRGGLLTRVPNKRKKFLVVLRWMARLFQPDTLYTEKEVNDLLKSVHPTDPVTLRRGLVDMGYLRRERGGGQYWLASADEKGPASR
jgi:DNA-binding HxlR family transcriptional regulator